MSIYTAYVILCGYIIANLVVYWITLQYVKKLSHEKFEEISKDTPFHKSLVGVIVGGFIIIPNFLLFLIYTRFLVPRRVRSLWNIPSNSK